MQGVLIFNIRESLPLCLLSSTTSDDDFDMSRYSSSGYSSAEVRPHSLGPSTHLSRTTSIQKRGCDQHQITP